MNYQGDEPQRQIEQLNEGLNKSNVRKLPSRFQIGDKVSLNFNDGGTLTGCEIIKVHFTESKVLYDVELTAHYYGLEDKLSEETFSTRLYNLDSAFFNAAERPVLTVHGLIHDASYELSQGNLDAAKDILRKADLITHDMCEHSGK